MKKFNIILPIFNQEKNIKKNLILLEQKLKKLNCTYKLILVDDKSTDNSLKIIKKFKKKNIIILSNKKNMGKGYSIKYAFSKIDTNCFVVIWDSDLPYFDRINLIIKALEKSNFQFVSINRKLIKSKIFYKEYSLYAFLRILIGYIFNFFSRILFSITCRDTQAGLKGFEGSLVKHFKKIINNGFLFDLEMFIILKKLNFKPKYISCNYTVNRKSSIKIFNVIFMIKVFFEFIKIYKFYKLK